MALVKLEAVCERSWRGYAQVVQMVVVALALALPVTAVDRCAEGVIDCERDCDFSSLNYQPQRCDDCCTDSGKSVQGNKKNDGTSEQLDAMKTEIGELRVMVGVLLALVVLILLALVAVLLLRHTSERSLLKLHLPVFYKSKEDGSHQQKQQPTPTKISMNANANSVVRIANYQNKHSPLAKRMRPNSQHGTEDSVMPHDPPPAEHYRNRHPSESTCPDESADLSHPHQHAYDNLALSTSTLHDTTTSSSSTLGPAVSTNTLETTLPSVTGTVVLRDPDSNATRI